MDEPVEVPREVRAAPWLSWRQEIQLGAFVLGTTCAAIALAFWHGAWLPGLLGLCGAPVYLTYRSYRVFQDRMAEERRRVLEESGVQFAIIEALASAIEAKEPTARSDLRHLQVTVECLAQAVGMSPADVEAVQTAALLHDIGNLAVPEHVLRKKGPLSAEEVEKVRSHARIGANLLASVPFPRPVAPLVEAHHERWDGKGYPAGLTGEAIPLGARVLAVADMFTALQADRPHRDALSAEEALGFVRSCAGQALDPSIVETLVKVHPAIQARLREGSAGAGLDVTPTSAAPSSRPYDEITAAHLEAELFEDTALALVSSQGVFETMMQVWLRLQEVLPVSCCALFLWNETTGRFECRFAAGENDSMARDVTATTVDDLARPLAAPPSIFTPADWNVGLESAVACPLTLDDHPYGALVAYDVGPHAYTDEHRRLLARVADQAARVIGNAITFDEMQRGSLADALTGLPNRRGMQHYLQRELARARSIDGVSLALMVADLDEFKPINDTLGHEVGDRVLQAVADAMRGAIQPDDLCARFAGDEFVLALRGCGPEQAARMARVLADTVRATRVEADGADPMALSISIGIATFPQDGTTVEALFAAADRRMYDVKAARQAPVGRRQSRTSPAPPEPLGHDEGNLCAGRV